jgi:hypothetical protein
LDLCEQTIIILVGLFTGNNGAVINDLAIVRKKIRGIVGKEVHALFEHVDVFEI